MQKEKPSFQVIPNLSSDFGWNESKELTGILLWECPSGPATALIAAAAVTTSAITTSATVAVAAEAAASARMA